MQHARSLEVWIVAVRRLLAFTQDKLPLLLAADVIAPEVIPGILKGVTDTENILREYEETADLLWLEIITRKCAILAKVWEDYEEYIPERVQREYAEIMALFDAANGKA